MKSALNLASIDMQHDDISTTWILGYFWGGHLQKSPAVVNFRLPKKSEKNQGFLLHEQDPECGAARWKLDILVFWNALTTKVRDPQKIFAKIRPEMSGMETKWPKNAHFSLFPGKTFGTLGLFMPCFADIQKCSSFMPHARAWASGWNIHHCNFLLML